ncbi:MAG TPA: QueT transporter family protein [Clostridia bacterium]|nr:QueT transporter family protein [Clostridia bacterium]
MGEIKTNYIVKTAIIAATYAVLTMLLAPISYGPIQFRVSEIMVLLVFIDKRYFTGIALGTFLAGLFSPYGMLDAVVGTIATIVALGGIIAIRSALGDNLKSLIIASLAPTIANGMIIGWLISYSVGIPFLMPALQVALGEFVVVSIVGVTLIRWVQKNEMILSLLKIHE